VIPRRDLLSSASKTVPGATPGSALDRAGAAMSRKSTGRDALDGLLSRILRVVRMGASSITVIAVV
jgi:hypothetical protein